MRNSLRFALPLIFFAATAYISVRFFGTETAQAPLPPGDSVAVLPENSPVTATKGTPGPQTPDQQALTVAEQEKLATLDELLASGNDSDPRVDSFQNLSGPMKSSMRARYASLALEKRNARGTIVYILGRELEASDDVRFLESVLAERPCLSLKDCSQPPNATDEHEAMSGVAVTLVYPQMVALKSIEQFLEKSPTIEMRTASLNTLRKGRLSESPRVSADAQKILDRYER